MPKKYYQLTPNQRIDQLAVDSSVKEALSAQQDDVHQQLIENYVSEFGLPLGTVQHILVDGHEYTVPMVTEEPSVVAAANNGARLLNLTASIQTEQKTRPTTTGQLLFEGVSAADLIDFVDQQRPAIEAAAKAAKPSIYERGGGLVAVRVRQLDADRSSVDFDIDTQAAMGANIVNTILEAQRTVFDDFDPYFVAAILSNYAPEQVVKASGKVAVADLGGLDVAKRIASLSQMGAVDIYRATTENKGIYNGVAAVTLATGNDTRAVEAAGHAWAGRSGQYQSLSHWQLDQQGQFLVGSLTLPLPVGTVGGAIGALTAAQSSLAILGNPNRDQLRSVIAAVGLAQNLAALKALSSEGIQAGHMRMQARALAVQVGARPDEVAPLVRQLLQSKRVDSQTALHQLEVLRQDES